MLEPPRSVRIPWMTWPILALGSAKDQVPFPWLRPLSCVSLSEGILCSWMSWFVARFPPGFQSTGATWTLSRDGTYSTWSCATLAQTGQMVKMMNIFHLSFTLKISWISSGVWTARFARASSKTAKPISRCRQWKNPPALHRKRLLWCRLQQFKDCFANFVLALAKCVSH